jgi:hypothetical protein
MSAKGRPDRQDRARGIPLAPPSAVRERELVRYICEYRALRARRDLLQLPLGEGERLRLEALQRLFTAGFAVVPDAQDRRRFTRLDVDIPAVLGATPVVITNLGGGGLVVAPAPVLRRGELTVVRVVENAREYFLPAQALWSQERSGRSRLGLCFVGVPSMSDRPLGNA